MNLLRLYPFLAVPALLPLLATHTSHADPLRPRFRALNLNQDGRVTLPEVLAAPKELRPSRPSQDPAPPAPPAPPVPAPTLAGLGRRIPLPARFTDVNGTLHSLSAFSGPRGLVIAMTSSTCPLSRRFLPSLSKLEKELSVQGIGLLLVNPFSSEPGESVTEGLRAAHIQTACADDSKREWTSLLCAQSTTEVFLLDPSNTLLYRGAIDDQYGIGHSRDTPSQNYLRDAIHAHLEGRRPPLEATPAPGCELEPPTAPPHPTPLTYHGDIARILQRHCSECHTNGGIAPFSLENSEEVLDRTRALRRVLQDRTMPPWFAVPTHPGHPSPWRNDRSLPERDRQDLLAWLNSGDHPLGDPAQAPLPPPRKPRLWTIGSPDIVLQIPTPIPIPAEGTLPYQFVTVQNPLAEDRWIEAYEILPTSREVVHHVLVNVHPQGTPPSPQGEGYWAVYVPGNGHLRYPEGHARKLPARATLSFQIHYTPTGKSTEDQLRIGLVFSKTPPTHEVHTAAVTHHRIQIPPHAAAHVETFQKRLSTDFSVSALMAHMHVRGKSFRYEAQFPDGHWETLLDLPKYDFQWQLRYEFIQPRLLPKGTTVKITATFDNSSGNKANPDPSQTVRWGQQTSDEMMIGYAEYATPVAPPVSQQKGVSNP
jgi:hypothetical protein